MCINYWRAGTGGGSTCFRGWHERRRFKVAPTLTGAFASDDVISNGVVLPILKAALEQDVRLMTFATDCNAVGSTAQGIHRDLSIAQLQSDSYAEHMSSVLVANIAMRDVTLQDGPMELWPGTHMHDLTGLDFEPNRQSADTDVNTTDGAAFAQLLPHAKVLMKAGDILVRDPHMLHRGTAYSGDKYRLIATLIYRGNEYDRSKWGYMDVQRFAVHPKKKWRDISQNAAPLLMQGPACWKKLPTGCSNPLGEVRGHVAGTADTGWFLDMQGQGSREACAARVQALNTWCTRNDAVFFWGASVRGASPTP